MFQLTPNSVEFWEYKQHVHALDFSHNIWGSTLGLQPPTVSHSNAILKAKQTWNPKFGSLVGLKGEANPIHFWWSRLACMKLQRGLTDHDDRAEPLLEHA